MCMYVCVLGRRFGLLPMLTEMMMLLRVLKYPFEKKKKKKKKKKYFYIMTSRVVKASKSKMKKYKKKPKVTLNMDCKYSLA